jgi:hypothetical protein
MVGCSNKVVHRDGRRHWQLVAVPRNLTRILHTHLALIVDIDLKGCRACVELRYIKVYAILCRCRVQDMILQSVCGSIKMSKACTTSSKQVGYDINKPGYQSSGQKVWV